MEFKIFIVLLVMNAIAEIKSAKILAVFPMPSISHQVVFRPLTQELARRGHDVTIITPDPAFAKGAAIPNLREIDVHDISYQTWRDCFLNNYEVDSSGMALKSVSQIYRFFIKLIENQLQVPEVQEIINDNNNTFDLLLIEAMVRPALLYSHIFKAPVILISSLGVVLNHHKVLGMHTHPVLYPTTIQKRIYNCTITEKLHELYKYYAVELIDYLSEANEDKFLKNTFGMEFPPVSELNLNIDMLFLNIYPIWTDNQAMPSNVLFIGGIHSVPEKEIPKDLKEYLDNSKHGVIYLSFGTNILADLIPPEKIQIIVKVLSELPYDVLWKWDKNELPGKSNNIKISKWYPQSDLLRHPKVKLFITQAGLQSTDEAITGGVPLIAIPMLGDQWYNAEKYVKHGIGKQIDLESLTVHEFKSAVETVIKDESYRKNIQKFRKILRDQPTPPLESAVWWTEYVIRHGGAKHLRTPAANLSHAQYFEIEVLLIILSVILAASIVFVSLVFYTVRLIRFLLVKKNYEKTKKL